MIFMNFRRPLADAVSRSLILTINKTSTLLDMVSARHGEKMKIFFVVKIGGSKLINYVLCQHLLSCSLFLDL